MVKSRYTTQTRANLLRELLGATQEDIAGKAGLSDGTVGKHLRGKVSAQNSKDALTEAFMYMIDEFMLATEAENPLPAELQTREALKDFLFDRRTHNANGVLNKDLSWLQPKITE